MRYQRIRQAVFLSRPNRFIAVCLLDGEAVTCHVKNTGRCRELLVSGCTVFLEEQNDSKRKTKFDLVAVRKGDVLFNIDAMAPNRVFGEWLKSGGLFEDMTLLVPEKIYGNSRFDFYAEHGGKRAFIEVKGVTPEENGVFLFPDAPTERGLRHIQELCDALANGYEAYIVFVVQAERACCFTPNRKTQPAFADALREAAEKGVKILCYSCKTEASLLEIAAPVKIIL